MEPHKANTLIAARDSTVTSTPIQLDRIFTDKASGKDTKRPQLDELLRFIRDGDTLVVHSMD